MSHRQQPQREVIERAQIEPQIAPGDLRRQRIFLDQIGSLGRGEGASGCSDTCNSYPARATPLAKSLA